MPKVKFLKPFKYSPDGIKVIEFSASREGQEVDDQCAQIACDNGFAEAVGRPAKPGKKEPTSVDTPPNADAVTGDEQVDAGSAQSEAA